MQRLVPVVVRQFVEEPQRIVMGASIESLERLLPLDYCLFRGVKADDFVTDSLGEESARGVTGLVPVVEDRKLDLGIDDLVVGFRHFADQMIEHRAAMVEHFTDKKAKDWRRLVFRERLYEKVVGLRLEIVDNSIRVTGYERLDYLTQLLEVGSYMR